MLGEVGAGSQGHHGRAQGGTGADGPGGPPGVVRPGLSRSSLPSSARDRISSVVVLVLVFAHLTFSHPRLGRVLPSWSSRLR